MGDKATTSTKHRNKILTLNGKNNYMNINIDYIRIQLISNPNNNGFSSSFSWREQTRKGWTMEEDYTRRGENL